MYACYQHQRLTIFWGDSTGAFCIQREVGLAEVEKRAVAAITAAALSLATVHSVILLKQVHGTHARLITPYNLTHYTSQSPRFYEGDALITTESNIGLAVATADCIPLVLYDPYISVIAVIHAGWQGSAAGIVMKTVALIQREFGCRTSYLQAFLGPSAQSCCYEVTPEFHHNFKNAAIIYAQRDHRLYFDLPGYITSELLSLGLEYKNINSTYNVCTICAPNFNSHRRNGLRAGRNITVAALSS